MSEDGAFIRQEVELLIDEGLAKVSFLHPLADISIWHLFTVSEDRIRLLFNGYIKKDEMDFYSIIDESKYELRHAITQVLNSSSNTSITLPDKTNPTLYERAAELLQEAGTYENLSRIVASTYSSDCYFKKVASGYKLEGQSRGGFRYSVLEVLGHGSNMEPDVTGVLYEWLQNGAYNVEGQFILESLTNSGRIKRSKVIYDYQPSIACGIASQLPQREIIIPEGFKFDWGGSFETHVMINSLMVRCLYHVLSIELVARKNQIRGGGESSLVLILTKEQLIADIQVLADFEYETICKFVEMLTFGNKAITPDIALQPLYFSKSGQFMIPCYHILNSNIQRNLLSLLAKIDKKQFDKQSDIFEKIMISQLEVSLQSWKHYSLNKEYKVNGVKEEIDGLIIDKNSKTVLLMELRWILQPGDVREVYNKIKATSSKVNQLARKITFVEDNLSEIILRTTGCLNDFLISDNWQVKGVVVIQGFGGTVSQHESIPIVTLDIFKKAIINSNSLRELHSWINGLSWLPSEDHDFKLDEIKESNGLVNIFRTAVSLLVNKQQYSNYLDGNIEFNLKGDLE